MAEPGGNGAQESQIAEPREVKMEQTSPPPLPVTSQDGANDQPGEVDAEMKDAADMSPKSAPTKKKKGMATSVKAPKKGRGIKKKPIKKKTDQLGSSPTTAGPNSGGDSEDDESDNGPYCICRGPDDHRWMIQCDGCEDWFHGECVNISKDIGETLIQSYICPSCTDGKKYVTRYKKTCSLDGCMKPARVYSPKEPSIFCSQEHCNQWWEKLISTLPRDRDKDNEYRLTQEEFMGLLASTGRPDVTWKLGDVPLGVPPHFWDTISPTEVLTAEETLILSTSATNRHQLAEEIVLCNKMLHLLELANDRHRAAIDAKAMEKDACGYDARLDAVGVQAQFAAFVQSPDGEAIFANAKGGKLGAPVVADGGFVVEGQPADPRIDGMCRRRKCKPHNGWLNTHTRHVRFQIKELTREARERLDKETRVRDSAARRYFRRKYEDSTVTVLADEADRE